MTNAAAKTAAPQVQILVTHRDYPARVMGWTTCAPEQVPAERVRFEAQGYRLHQVVAA